MQLFMAFPMTPSAAVVDFGGRRNRQFIPFNFLLSLAAPHLNGVLDLVTGNKFIAGVAVTNISANFRKNSKWLQWNTWGPGGH
jgi:hypothetical protein